MDVAAALGVAKMMCLTQRTTSSVMQTPQLLPEGQTRQSLPESIDIEAGIACIWITQSWRRERTV